MNTIDKITLFKILFSVIFAFILLPYFILVKKIYIHPLVSNLLIVINWVFVYIIGRLSDKGMKGTIIYGILFFTFMCISLPILLWSVAATWLNG